jgi:hypothetical protein
MWELIVCIGLNFTECTSTATFPDAKACYVASQRIDTPLNKSKMFYCKPVKELVANV